MKRREEKREERERERDEVGGQSQIFILFGAGLGEYTEASRLQIFTCEKR
jgi:hypothetical protein